MLRSVLSVEGVSHNVCTVDMVKECVRVGELMTGCVMSNGLVLT